jgi:hypothetical protein
MPVSGPPAADKKIACLLKAAKLMCSHGRNPSPDGTLQVVAPEVGDKITLHADIAGTCGKHPEWAVSGSTQASYTGTDTSFRATPWRCGKWWAADSGSHDYAVSVASCSGDSRSFLVQAFPSDTVSVKCDLTSYSEAFEKFTTAIQEGISAVVDEPDKPFEFLKGGIEVSANWQERDQDYRVFWKFQIAIEFDPLVKGTAEAPLKVVPPGISFLGDFYLFADISAEIDVSVQWGQLSPDHLDASGEAKGEVDLKIGARLNLMHKEVLQVEVSISTGLTFDVTTQHEGLHIWLDAELSWEGAKGDLEAKALWGLFSYKNEVVLWDSKRLGSWEWDPVEELADYIRSQ